MGTVRNLCLGEPTHSGRDFAKHGPIYRWQNVWCNLLSQEGADCMWDKLLVSANVDRSLIDFETIHNECGSKNGKHFIVVIEDMSGRVHLDYVKEAPWWLMSIVLHRSIQYAEHGEVKLDGVTGEGYVMPRVWVLDLEGSLPSDNSRTVHLVSRDDPANNRSFTFPVVSVPDKIPVLKGLQECENLGEIRSRVRDLYRQLGGDGGYIDSDLLKFCAALSDHRLYEELGATHGYVDLVAADESRLGADALNFNPRVSG